MSKISETYIRELRSLLSKVSPGPWVSLVEGRDHTSGSSFIKTGADGDRGEDIELLGGSPADQDFIARARQDVPLLLDEVERLKGLLRGSQTAAE
ncbi:MAG: hypothetical protein AB7T59_03615 [Hyphomonadaceae bacterium]